MPRSNVVVRRKIKTGNRVLFEPCEVCTRCNCVGSECDALGRRVSIQIVRHLAGVPTFGSFPFVLCG